MKPGEGLAKKLWHLEAPMAKADQFKAQATVLGAELPALKGYWRVSHRTWVPQKIFYSRT